MHSGVTMLVVGVLAVAGSCGLSLLAIRLHLLAPLSRMRASLVALRNATGQLPDDLPVHRSDEIGWLAREVALIAGDRNVSELRRRETESRMAALTDATPDAVFRIDRDGVVLEEQPPKEVPFFVEADSVVGKKLTDVFPEQVTDCCVEALADVFLHEGGHRQFDFELEVGGEPRSYQARFARASTSEALVIIRDRTRFENTVISRARYHTILDNTLDPVVTVTPSGVVQYMNPACRALLRVRDPQDATLHLRNFLPAWAESLIFSTAIPAAVEDGVWRGDAALVGPRDEEETPVALTAVSHRTRNGAIDLISFIARDQSEQKRFDDRLSFLADHDPLTSLYTRRRFVEDLAREIARAHRTGTGGAVVVMDLDDFRYVNDSVGHRNGDRFLSGLAQLLKKTVRANDLLARLDGDEFAILITETQPSRVDFIVERLLKAVRNHFLRVGEQPIGVTASAGVVLFPEQRIEVEDLLAKADQALHVAKRRGRDQFVLFKPDEQWQARVDTRMADEKLLRDALARERFVLYAQPILDLRANKVTQYEVLLRMLGENDELIPPASFLPSAERFGLIRSLDRWVVRRSIRLLGEQCKVGNRLRLSVNLSGKSLGDFELTTLIENELKTNGVDPGQLTLEITETAAISDQERAKIFAIALKQIGCRLALDDFGVGLSNMNNVKQLPVDYLKIDGSFIRDLPNNRIDQHLVKAIVEIARGLRKRTVAEFVGSEDTLKVIRDAGVDFAQGFHVAKPDALEKFLPSPSAA